MAHLPVGAQIVLAKSAFAKRALEYEPVVVGRLGRLLEKKVGRVAEVFALDLRRVHLVEYHTHAVDCR